MQRVYIISDLGVNSSTLTHLCLKLEAAGYTIRVLTASIAPYDLNEAIFYSSCLWSGLEEDSIVLFMVGQARRYVVSRLAGKILIAPDNGILGMLIVKNELQKPDFYSTREELLTFFNALTKEGYEKLKNGFLKAYPSPVDRIAARPVFREEGIIVPYICSDRFGNAYFDLSKQEFDQFIGEGKFRIHIPRVMEFNKLSAFYSDVKPGDALARFFNQKYLQIAIHMGNATQLMAARNNNQLYIDKG